MNETIEINVPKEIEFISDWKEFKYPLGHAILDKSICGCGFTEFCLVNSLPTILCSPRKTLLENKISQHKEDENIYYFCNEYDSENYDKEIEEKENLENISKLDKQNYLVNLKNQLKKWYIHIKESTNLSPKILVTYDSLHHVLDVLGELINEFFVVVDEFQSIFMDSSFKATVELDFVEDLKKCLNVLLISATPQLKRYLSQLDYFKDLDFYKLIWDSSRIENVRIERRFVSSMNKEVSKIISDYRNSIFPIKILSNGEKRESREVVFFVNSVKTICDIVKKNKLTPEETNIICSRTSKNIEKLKKVKHTIGEAPLKGEYHKMFTFCTRTTYLGSDFYSTNAYTVICSDCNVNTLTVDISLDLPQIVGRQRLKENVFRNEVLFLYKARTKKDAILNMDEKDFDEYIRKKDEKTDTLLVGYSKMSEEEKKEWSEKAANDKTLYQNDYLGVSNRTGMVVKNNLVKLANQRAYDVSRREYQDSVTIKRGIESREGLKVFDSKQLMTKIDVRLNEFANNLENTGIFEDKLELIYNNQDLIQYPLIQSIIPLNIQNYITLVGLDKMKALKFVESSIKEYISSLSNLSSNRNDIISLFEVGKRYTSKQIKQMLKDFYTTNDILKTPKSTDLLEYFVVKDCQVIENGKKTRGIEILKRKDGI